MAVVTLATVSIAEPLALWTHIDHFDAHLAYLSVAAAGFAFPLVWFRRDWRNALKAVVFVVVLTYPAALVLEAVSIAFGQISPPMRLI
jgi:cation transport ATPase